MMTSSLCNDPKFDLQLILYLLQRGSLAFVTSGWSVSWMHGISVFCADNRLSLNPDKSEAIVVSTGARLRQEGTISSASLGGTSIPVILTVSEVWAYYAFRPPRGQRQLTAFYDTRHFGESGNSSRSLTQRTLQLLLLDPDLTIVILYCMACLVQT